MTRSPQDGTTSRREMLRHGKKLAYVAPAVIVALHAQPAFSASGNGPNNNNNNNSNNNNNNPKNNPNNPPKTN
jgi:hypothetical protein